MARKLNDAEKLCVQRLLGRKPLTDIAQRIGVSLRELKEIIKNDEHK